MTKQEAIELLGPIAEAITLLSSEKEVEVETKVKKTRKSKKETPKEEPEKKAEETKDDDSFFEDDGPEVTARNAGEVKTLVINWINDSPDERRKIVQETFEKATGLAKMNLVTEENATEVYGKLEAAFK